MRRESDPDREQTSDQEADGLKTHSRVEVERIIEYQSDLGRGAFLRRLTGKPDSPLFNRPYGVAWLGDDLLVSDPAAGRVVRIPSRGKKTKSSSPALLEGPIGLAVCSSGIVVSDSRSGDVALLDADLKLVRWLARELERPTGVACQDDQVYVAETGRHRLLIIEPDGTVTTIGERGYGLGEFNFPAAIAIAGDTLWVGDTLNFRIQRISLSSGKALSAFGQLGDSSGETPRIKGIAVDGNGNLWVSDALLDQVSIFNQNGEYLMRLGESGAEPGKLSFPAGVSAHSDGRVAIVDSLNRRVQIFRLQGKSQERE
jgi:DNA-binding beta-propeller fold protein YncE